MRASAREWGGRSEDVDGASSSSSLFRFGLSLSRPDVVRLFPSSSSSCVIASVKLILLDAVSYLILFLFLLTLVSSFRIRANSFYDRADSVRSGYLSDRESQRIGSSGFVQQTSIESNDSRLCYLTSSEVGTHFKFFHPPSFSNFHLFHFSL